VCVRARVCVYVVVVAAEWVVRAWTAERTRLRGVPYVHVHLFVCLCVWAACVLPMPLYAAICAAPRAPASVRVRTWV